MMIYLNGKPLRLNPRRLIGAGGEAEVYDIGKQRVAKIFKSPQHPDYHLSAQAQTQAQQRLTTHQQKLPNFPQHLPDRVVQPLELIRDDRQQIIGYTMRQLQPASPLLKYSDRGFRQGVSHQQVVRIFQDLHDTVSKLHFAGIIIGDFNDLNVLIQADRAYLIDADSFQFDAFLCSMFTAKFVDPLLCDPQADQPTLVQPYTDTSDWYAFAVMLFQSLLFVDPFGGLYKPSDPQAKIPQSARSLHRISVFHPDVKYPKPALPYCYLPDEVLHQFDQMFTHDRREPWPRSLLDQVQWRTCPTCGIEHARSTCPDCTPTQPGRVVSVTVVRGTVTATTLVQTTGIILAAAAHPGINHGRPAYLLWENGEFRRETGEQVMRGTVQPHQRWHIQGDRTWRSQAGVTVGLQAGQAVAHLAVDDWQGEAPVHVQAHLPADTLGSLHWLDQGRLYRQGHLGAEVVGTVLADRTQFWVGSTFGFGVYRAGQLTTGFVFDRDRGGLNDQVPLPMWPGELIGMSCTFSDDYAWVWALRQHQGHRRRSGWVVSRQGQVVASAEADVTQADHWLMQLDGAAIVRTPSPFCAVGSFLLAATDAGIMRLDLHQGQIHKTRTFPDTEPFVDGQTQLLPAPGGLYAVGRQHLTQLKLT